MLKCGNIIKKQKFSKASKVWAPDPNGIHYDSLDPASQREVDETLDSIVGSRYDFIHYNGLLRRHLEEKYEVDYFDGSLTIIDEAHKFVSAAMSPGSVANELYGRLYKSSSRILLLTGTPIMNEPFELALLLNLVSGPVRTFELPRSSREKEHYDVYEARGRLVAMEPPEGFVKKGFAFVRSSSDVKDVQDKNTRVTHNLPMDKVAFDNLFCDFENETVKNGELFMRRIVGFTSHFDERDEALYPTVHERVLVNLPMSDYQFSVYGRVRLEEIKKERNNQRAQRVKTDLFSKSAGNGVYKSFSRALCNFVFPEDVTRPYMSSLSRGDDDEDDEDEVTLNLKQKYHKKLDEAISKLKGNLGKGQIEKFSPKMAAIADRIEASKDRKSLVYSNFRTAEGLQIMSLVLEARGFQKLTHSKGLFHASSSSKDAFVVYDSSSNILVDAFNDGSVVVDGKKINVSIILIAVSGSEGISLKNVREVHLLEPFWNDVRLQQVIGRAVRAGSHAGLPVEDRNVSIFQYLVHLPDKDAIFVLRTADRGLSADELVLEIAARKKKMSGSFLNLLRASSIDCNIHRDGAGCFNLPPSIPDEALVRTARFEDDLDDRRFSRAHDFSVAKPVKRIVVEDENGVFIPLLELSDGRFVDAEIYRVTGRYREVSL